MANKMRATGEKVVVQSVDRALSILALFRTESSLGLTQIADRMNLAKSTVYGLIATLEKHGYLEQDLNTGKYRLGVRLLEMGGLFEKRLNLRREVAPVMKSLVERFAETVQVSILDGCEVVYIDLLEAPTSLRFTARIGMRAPAHCTATGKVMLADLPEGLLDELYGSGPLPMSTPVVSQALSLLRNTFASSASKGTLWMTRRLKWEYEA